MITLLGSLLGFTTSFMPKVLDYFQDRSDKKHELMMMDKQLEMDLKKAELNIIQTRDRTDVERYKSAHQEASTTQKLASSWTATYSSTVRPTITYLFMALFIFVEVSAYMLLIQKGVSAGDAASIIWDHEIQGLFAAIMSYWFGNRTHEKLKIR